MDKTVSADFESVDLATTAAKNVTSRYPNIKKVKVSYQKISPQQSGRSDFSPGFVFPVGTAGGISAGTGIDSMSNGILPYGFGFYNTVEDESYPETERSSQKARVSVTAPGKSSSVIAATLLQGGGRGVKVT